MPSDELPPSIDDVPDTPDTDVTDVTDPSMGFDITLLASSIISVTSSLSARARLLRPEDLLALADQSLVAFFESVQGPRTESIEGFGLSRFVEDFVSIVGESSEVDYGGCEVVCKVNSIDGTFEFAENLNKYDRVEVDIVNPSFSGTGLPHWVVEDTFEWVNSGMPSHLSQVYHSNISNFGIAFERSNPGHIEQYAPPYQGRFYASRNNEWYDWFNSTVDFESVGASGEVGYSLPYANSVLYVPSLGKVLVGGQGHLLSIRTTDYEVSRIEVDSRRAVFIKDMYLFEGYVYILDENSLYIWDLTEDSIVKDKGLGLPDRLCKVAVMLSQSIVIGAEDGIYARKTTQDSWQKVVATTSPVDIMISPDSIFAVSNNEFWYSSEGFTWVKIGSISDKNVNQIAKHRSQIIVGTDLGAHGDNGSLYSNRISLSLIDLVNDLEESAEVAVNAVASDFSSAVFGLSDGRYIVWSDSFTVYEDSNLLSIHKAVFIDEDIWLFGYDRFKIHGLARIRRLATGESIPGHGQTFAVDE